LNIPVKEGREKLERILSALVDAPECYIPVRGPWVPLSDAQQANWEARQTISKLLREGTAELTPVDESAVPESIGWGELPEEETHEVEPVYAVLSPAEERALLEPRRVRVEAKQSNLLGITYLTSIRKQRD
jgi:hypothetical protein